MRKRTHVVVLALAAVVLTLTACGGGEEESEQQAAGEKVVVELGEQNGSGQNGTATLAPVGDGSTKVTVALENPPMEAQPAHVHPGSCDDLDPQPAYALANVEGGNSETTIKAPLDELTGGDFAINVHKSEKDAETYVACGGIGSGEAPESSSDGY